MASVSVILMELNICILLTSIPKGVLRVQLMAWLTSFIIQGFLASNTARGASGPRGCNMTKSVWVLSPSLPVSLNVVTTKKEWYRTRLLFITSPLCWYRSWSVFMALTWVIVLMALQPRTQTPELDGLSFQIPSLLLTHCVTSGELPALFWAQFPHL